MEACHRFMKISRQGDLPLLTVRSFKLSWTAQSALAAASSLTNVPVSNFSYQIPLWIWFGSTPTSQVTMTMKMYLNSLIQCWKREETQNLRTTSAWTYLRSIVRWGIGYRTISSLSLRRCLTFYNQQNTTTGSLFSWTHGMSWRSRISKKITRFKMWTSKQIPEYDAQVLWLYHFWITCCQSKHPTYTSGKQPIVPLIQ